MTSAHHVPLQGYPRISATEMEQRSAAFLENMSTRRTVRMFSDDHIEQRIVENCIRTAASAPSGANRQPWHFVLVADPAMKRRIREEAELEEQKFYNDRAPQDWLDALAPLGTDAEKPFLETAPFLIVVFQQMYGVADDQTRIKNYYVPESVGIACGFLLAALHDAGLATLTHTPSPMKFLQESLQRPLNERAVMIIVVGHTAPDATVPVITKKPFNEICTIV